MVSFGIADLLFLLLSAFVDGISFIFYLFAALLMPALLITHYYIHLMLP